jgi:hypothetical protein
MTTARPTLALTLAAILAAACSNPGIQRIDTTTAGMDSTRQLLGRGDGDLERVLASARSMGATPDYKKNFEQFSSALDRLESTAKDARSSWASLTGKSEEYVKAWEAESLKLSSDQSREIAANRRQAYETRIKDLQKAMGELKDAYEPFVAEMSDARMLLAHDLNAEGIAAIAPMVKKAEQQAAVIRDKGAAATKIMEDLASRMATKGAAPAQSK